MYTQRDAAPRICEYRIGAAICMRLLPFSIIRRSFFDKQNDIVDYLPTAIERWGFLRLSTEKNVWIYNSRFQRSQAKAAVRVNTAMLEYYWSLGRDIIQKQAEPSSNGRCRTSTNRLASPPINYRRSLTAPWPSWNYANVSRKDRIMAKAIEGNKLSEDEVRDFASSTLKICQYWQFFNAQTLIVTRIQSQIWVNSNCNQATP